MNRIYNLITSRQTMGILFMILATVLAVATFIENDFGSQAARALVYNSWWFELIFLLLAINMAGNMLKFNMWHRKHLPVFLFHFSFFLIIAGAAVTRHFSYDGNMPIREGQTTNLFYSSDLYISVKAGNGTEILKKVFLSPTTPHEFSEKIVINEETYHIQSEVFFPNAARRPIATPGGDPLVGLLLPGPGSHQEIFLEQGEIWQSDDLKVGFEPPDTAGLDIFIKRSGNNDLTMCSSRALNVSTMHGGTPEVLSAGKFTRLTTGKIYRIGKTRLALSRFLPEAEFRPMPLPTTRGSEPLPDAVRFKIQGKEQSHTLYAFGKKGAIGKPASIWIGNTFLSIQYGSRPLKLPFSLKLNHFTLERYPGSQSPSSYTSEVTLFDPQTQNHLDYKIFMNNVFKFKGFRFYQSSYDEDEKGTILSVSHDFWGTLITYIGYFLLAAGMFWSLAAPGTRFRHLLRKTDKIYKQRKKLTLLWLLLIPAAGLTQTMPPRPDSEVAKALGKTWVQDGKGRIKPLNTIHQEVMVKLVKHNSFHGFNPDQMLLGMLTHPAAWQKVPLITVKQPQLKKTLGLTGPKAAFNDFFDPQQNYKIHQVVEAAYRKKASERNKLESEIIKVDEQVNVFFLAQSGQLHKMFPSGNHPGDPWLVPSRPPQGLSSCDSSFVKESFQRLIAATFESNQTRALEIVNDIKDYQKKHAKDLLPSDNILRAELLYNRLNIFLWLATLFFSLGIILVLYNITGLMFPTILSQYVLRPAKWIVIAGFTYHTFGLALRWYISGHAPWSNGYESMLFIGWAILLAGLIFSRRSPVVMAVTALFAGVVLMVSHLSWMNPEITPLVPVLKSYWLTLHVAVIIGGYGFLTLGALLGFLNLLLTGLQSPSRKKRIKETIDELTAINEMSLTVGLYLMTIGSFLGGIWANESWGRYWGWDPKETWSLITILIYAFVIHMRFIPGLRGKLAFNTAALISFSSVIMTYLGVNYYLSGLHSYAAGNPVPIPSAIYYILIVVTLLIVLAFWKENKIKNLNN